MAILAVSSVHAPGADETTAHKIKIVLVGDSTVADRTGWGLGFKEFVEDVNITADKPFGIYIAQNVKIIDSKIITPEGTNQFSVTNAAVTVR